MTSMKYAKSKPMTWQVKEQEDKNEMLLLHEIAHQLRILFDRRAQHLKLTRPQWRVLGILRRYPGSNQSQIADRMEVEPITLVRHLDRMAKAGWIERRPDPADRRANRIYLTPKVKDIVEEMREISLSLRQGALGGFSEKEHGILISYLARMKANVLQLQEKENKK